MSRGNSTNLPPLAQAALGAFIILIVIFIAITFMNSWNQSVVPTLSNESQQQTQQVENNFWGSITLIGIAGFIILIGIVAKSLGWI